MPSISTVMAPSSATWFFSAYEANILSWKINTPKPCAPSRDRLHISKTELTQNHAHQLNTVFLRPIISQIREKIRLDMCPHSFPARGCTVIPQELGCRTCTKLPSHSHHYQWNHTSFKTQIICGTEAGNKETVFDNVFNRDKESESQISAS